MAFRKRIFTIRSFYKELYQIFNNFGEIKRAFKRRLIDKKFTERIMLSVTQVNQCLFCSFGHTKAALSTGMSNQEIQEILNSNYENVPSNQKLALCFAQYYSENNGEYDSEYYNKLINTYGEEPSKDILTFIKFIYFGNLCGNTLEALMLRFTFTRIPNSNIFNEIVVVISITVVLPIVIILGLIVTTLRSVLQ